MLSSSSSSSQKRKRLVTPCSTAVQRRRLDFNSQSTMEVLQREICSSSSAPPPSPFLTRPTFHLQETATTTPCLESTTTTTSTCTTAFEELFIFSPFGLCCRHHDCRTRPQIQLDEAAIQKHLKKHSQSLNDYRLSKVRSIFKSFKDQVDKARSVGNIDEYRHDNISYTCFTCVCGETFPNRKHNAIRHCKKKGCDATKIQNIKAIRLRCGRFVTESQIATFFKEPPSCLNQQFDYAVARNILKPLLPEREKNEHTYTHMYIPLIMRSGGGADGAMFLERIKQDYAMIHSPPNLPGEALLLSMHELAERW